MTDAPHSAISLPGLMGAHMHRHDDTIRCSVDAIPEICTHGIVRGSVLVMLVDVGAGWAAEQNADQDWTFTVDIGIRRTPVPTSRLEGSPVVQRAGRTISVDLPLGDSHGVATAAGVSTFIRLPRRPQDPAPPVFPLDPRTEWPQASAPLDELLAPESVAGGLRVELRPELLNPAGILQGGVAALLAEVAAERALERLSRSKLVATSFDVRYVTMGRVGPIDAVVQALGTRAAVVKLIDRGADDAVVTHNLIGFDEVAGSL